jgi:hypothetical protein
VAGDRWAALVDEAREVASDYLDRGKAMPRWKAKAAQTVVSLHEDTTSRELLVTVAAMHLLRESRPARFKSDRAFGFQVTRRCRNLTTASRGTWWDEQSGKVRHVYRTPPEAEVLALAGHLNTAFGALGLALARVVLEEQRKAGELEERTRDAIRELVEK